MVGLLGEKFTFFQLSWDNQNFQESQISCSYQCCPSDRLVRNNLNYASTSNIQEVMKFYNPGHKTFQTDFSWMISLQGKSIKRGQLMPTLAFKARKLCGEFRRSLIKRSSEKNETSQKIERTEKL